MGTTKREKLASDRIGDMKKFFTKVNLMSTLNGYEGEKLTISLASCLQGNALDCYMRLSDEDKVDVEKIKSELFTEYEIGRRDREQAVMEFANRSRLINEPAETYAYKLQQLASLDYPDFDNAANGVIVKDAYVRGIHPNLQLQLKSLEKFATADFKALVLETNRLEVTGVRPTLSTRPKDYINAVDKVQSTESENTVHEALVQMINDIAMEKLKSESVLM